MKQQRVSIKLIWLGAYFSVILLMCLVFFLGTVMVTNTVEKNIRQTNEDTATFMQKTLDDSWRSILMNSTQILSNTQAAELNSAESQNDFWSHETFNFVFNFQNYVKANDLVEDAFMYFPEYDRIVGNNGTHSSHAYWMTVHRKNKLQECDYETWMQELFSRNSSGYFTVQDGNSLALYYQISVYCENGRTLIVKIDTSVLEGTLGWICKDTENNFLAMVDQEGKVCAYSGNYNKFVDAETNQLAPVDENNYLYTKRASGVNTLSYVTIKELNQAYHQSNAVKNIALVFLLFAFLCGVAAAAFWAVRSAQPVEQLAQKLIGGGQISGNELYYIDQQVDDLLQDNKNALDALEKERSRVIGRTFLSECLKFTQTDNRDVETIAAICGISLENRLNTILVRERSGMDYSSDMTAVLDELENERDVVCCTQKQDLDILLINYDEESAVQNAERVFRQHSSEKTKIVQSKPADSAETIRSSYLDCLRQLQRKEVVLMPHTEEPRKAFEDLTGRSLLGTFQKYLSDEDYIGARQLVPELCQGYLLHADPLEQTCSRYAIIHQLLGMEGTRAEMRRQLEALAGETSLDGVETRLKEILTQYSRWKTHSMESENDVAGKARSIVDEQYSDPLLSLQTISDEMGVSQSYISRMFKKKYEIGIAQYISRVRIENAKALIRSGSANIKMISLQVGFSSDAQFIRVFKKMEDMTPGAYRAACQQ